MREEFAHDHQAKMSPLVERDGTSEVPAVKM